MKKSEHQPKLHADGKVILKVRYTSLKLVRRCSGPLIKFKQRG